MRGKEFRHPDFGGLRLDLEPVHPMAVKAQNVDLRKPGLLSKRPGLRRLNHIRYSGAIVLIENVQRICDFGKFLVIGDPNFSNGGQVYQHGNGTGGTINDSPFDPLYPPVAAAAGGPLAGVAPLAVAFSSAGSNDPNGGALTYLWTFGDGGTSNQPNPAHVYAAAGAYVATLTVANAAGKTATAVVPVTVASPVGHWDGASLTSVWEAGP